MGYKKQPFYRSDKKAVFRQQCFKSGIIEKPEL
jgi:hypothetical protein